LVNDSYQRLNTEGKKKRDVPNIADYSIWYLQLPLKKKEEKEPADTDRATCPLYNYPDMAKLSYRRSFTHGIKCNSCDFMGNHPLEVLFKKKSLF